MPNRIIKDSICTSPNVDALSHEAEVFFYRLIVQCDDYGRMDARAAILRARCYPLRVDSVSPADIDRWLSELAAAGLARLYEVDGGRYLVLATWDKHQQVRAKRSKYPQPPPPDGNCNQLISDDYICPRNPIQSNPNPIQSAPDGAGRERDEKPQADAVQSELVRTYEANMPGTITMDTAQELYRLGRLHTPEVVARAIVEGAQRGAKSIRYIERMLENRAAEAAKVPLPAQPKVIAIPGGAS